MTNEFNTVCPTCGKRFYSIPNPKILRTVKKCEACKKESLKKSHYKYLKKYVKACKEKLGYADPYYFKHRARISFEKKKATLEKLGLERFFKCAICGEEVDRLQIGVYLKSKTCNKNACRTEWRNKKSLENYYKIRNSDKYDQYKIKHRQWWYRRKKKVEQC